MKNLILIIIASFFLTGCSLIPKVNFNTPNTVPQSVDKSKAKEVCKGKAEWNDDGTLKSCSKGYYRYAENYEKQERKMTLVERVRSVINKILGLGIFGVIILCLFVPGGFTIVGAILGIIFENLCGMGRQVNKVVARAIQRTRKQGVDLEISLNSELDEKHKKYIRKLKDKDNIK